MSGLIDRFLDYCAVPNTVIDIGDDEKKTGCRDALWYERLIWFIPRSTVYFATNTGIGRLARKVNELQKSISTDPNAKKQLARIKVALREASCFGFRMPSVSATKVKDLALTILQCQISTYSFDELKMKWDNIEGYFHSLIEELKQIVEEKNPSPERELEKRKCFEQLASILYRWYEPWAGAAFHTELQKVTFGKEFFEYLCDQIEEAYLKDDKELYPYLHRCSFILGHYGELMMNMPTRCTPTPDLSFYDFIHAFHNYKSPSFFYYPGLKFIVFLKQFSEPVFKKFLEEYQKELHELPKRLQSKTDPSEKIYPLMSIALPVESENLALVPEEMKNLINTLVFQEGCKVMKELNTQAESKRGLSIAKVKEHVLDLQKCFPHLNQDAFLDLLKSQAPKLLTEYQK